MVPDLEALIPDPADDAAPYPRVEAWEPLRGGARRRRGGKRSDMVRWAASRAEAHSSEVQFPGDEPQAQAMSFEYPVIQPELLPVRRVPSSMRCPVSEVETTNLVAQSAFLEDPS